MPLRASLVGLSLAATALAPAPALADERTIADFGQELSDPANQAAIAMTLAAMSEALLDFPIEPFTRAMETMDGGSVRDLPPDARLRDLAGPRAERLPSDIARETPRMMGRAADMAGAVEAMLPEFEAMAKRMKDALPRY